MNELFTLPWLGEYVGVLVIISMPPLFMRNSTLQSLLRSEFDCQLAIHAITA